MTSISDAVLEHLREVVDRPDLTGTSYTLVELLGRGGMGAVYLVMDLELQRLVALKVLSDPEPDEDAATQLMAEARVIARLEHPGIVPVHDVGRLADGRVFYTMKHVGGTRLDVLLRTRPPLAERLRIFQRICEPVAFAHARAVVHRDLKPENVMVGSFGEVLVMDWGLALRKDAAAGGPLAPLRGSDGPLGRVVGTPGYMAPEQARGETADERSDVYSLGGILYFLVTGAAPATTSEDSPAGRAPSGRRATAVVLSPRRIDTRIPRPLESIVLKAMAEDPSARYAGVAEFAGDVARFLADQRISAHRESVLERAGRFAHRHRASIALILAYLVMRVLLLFARRG